MADQVKMLMKPVQNNKTSLKTKMAVAITLLTAVLLATTGAIFAHFFRQALEDSISRQNFTLVSSLANQIDSKLKFTQQHLSGIAQLVTPVILSDPEKTRQFLADRSDSQLLFDHHLAIFSPTLTVLASVPSDSSTSPMPPSIAKYLQKTIDTKAPQISEPFFSFKGNNRPVIIFTAPILTEEGQVAAVLSGCLDLLKDNFLGHLTTVTLGETGYLFLYNQERTLIFHPKPERILQQDVPLGANKMFDRALEGFEGTDETITSWGLHSLSSFKRVPITNWILAANRPVVEAYAPIRVAKRNFLLVLGVMLLITATTTWLLMRHLTTPLVDLTQQVLEYPTTEPAREITTSTRDEIRVLAETFNQLFSRLSEKEQALKKQINFLQVLIDVMPNPVFFKDMAGRYQGCNKAFEDYVGITKENLKGKSVFEIAPPGLARTYHKADIDLLNQGAGKTQNYELSVTWQDGTQRQIIFYKATFCNPDGNLAGLVGTMLDITDRKKAEARLLEQESHLKFLSDYDPLTRLPNRNLFADRLQHTLAKAKQSGKNVALLLLDLDRFKTINDSLGHDAGNNILCQVAERLKTQVRESDTLARLGGDEFAMILEDVEESNSVLMEGQKILERLSGILVVEGNQLYLSASIGISLFPNDGDTPETLIKCAEVAMYRAKDQGRNNYQFYRPEMNERSKELLLLAGSLRQALSQKQFSLHYQPQIDIRSGQVVGAEALIRWHHPSLGMVSPGDFIPLAEATGLIVPLGDWVLRTACEKNKAWNDAAKRPIRISVNISALQFREPEFIDKVDQILAETGIDPSLLEMEITESVIMDDVDAAIMTLTDLKVRNINLALDDFGTGYSSLNYLQKFPLTHLKIDRSFVMDVCSSEQSAEIVSSIIALAQNMKIQVIAEGVETEEQMDFLRGKGCDEAQGFLISRPIPPEQMEQIFLGLAATETAQNPSSAKDFTIERLI
jgi:diguanylate cyclase (GGDEF)-like protein/PAS domain S-box-containing protein